MKFYGHRCKIARVGTFYVAVIRGESCFEKNAFEDTENPHPPAKTRVPVKEYLRKYSRYRKKFCFILKIFLRPILFHGKLSFDNLIYFKLYGNLNMRKWLVKPRLWRSYHVNRPSFEWYVDLKRLQGPRSRGATRPPNIFKIIKN